MKNALSLVDSMFRDFDLFDRVASGYSAQASFVPHVDIREEKDYYEMIMDLPGMGKKDIKLEYHDGLLTVTGERTFTEEEKEKTYYRRERRFGSFARSFRFGQNIKAEQIEAEFKDGVLSIKVRKPEEQKAQVISIN